MEAFEKRDVWLTAVNSQSSSTGLSGSSSEWTVRRSCVQVHSRWPLCKYTLCCVGPKEEILTSGWWLLQDIMRGLTSALGLLALSAHYSLNSSQSFQYCWFYNFRCGKARIECSGRIVHIGRATPKNWSTSIKGSSHWIKSPEHLYLKRSLPRDSVLDKLVRLITYSMQRLL